MKMCTTFWKTSLLLLLLGLSPFLASAQSSDHGAKAHLLFAYFKGNGEDGLHLAYSQDGLAWKPLKNDSSFLKPTAGKDRLMRDPSILRGPDNTYHMVWTVSWQERGIGYAYSKDLIHWSEQHYIPVMEQETAARNCWAPELFYDAASREYLIFWATTIPGRFPQTDGQDARGPTAPGWNHRIYYTKTKDFKTFSKTALLYEQGFNVIDAAIIHDGKRYVMLLKDETNKPFQPQKNIRLAFSPKATGPYSAPTAPITGAYWAEGPTAIKLGGQWFVYFDKYTEKQYGLIVSTDLKQWTDLSDQLAMPKGMRHGTVFEVPEAVVNGLLRLE
jgi:hypothetical protein